MFGHRQHHFVFRIATFLAITPSVISAQELIPYTWKLNGKEIGRLMVPPGYKERVWNYREGFVIYLKYPDHSEIFLQRGFMMRKPMLQGSDYKLTASPNQESGQPRVGIRVKSQKHWRESNLGIQSIGYDSVLPSQLAIFDKSLDSFASSKSE